MSRDMKPKRAPAKKKSHGGTLIGLFLGLVIGVVAAAAVVWYINKTPTPFNKQPAPAVPGKPETAKAAPAQPAAPGQPAPLPGKPGDPVPEKRFQFYDILPGKAEAKVDAAASDKAEAKADAKEPKEAKDAKDAKDGKDAKDKDVLKESVFLQAGSFQNAGDADNQKAKLALLGLEATIQQVMVQDKVWYRVRLGPYGRVDELNKVRAELAKQGVEASVAKKD